jgi:hypothetical protein
VLRGIEGVGYRQAHRTRQVSFVVLGGRARIDNA